jgi:hypothetical protein
VLADEDEMTRWRKASKLFAHTSQHIRWHCQSCLTVSLNYFVLGTLHVLFLPLRLNQFWDKI